MTREEAIKELNDHYDTTDEVWLDFPKLKEALEMAISALEDKDEWIPVSSGKLPNEIKTKGHGLCHVLVTHKYAGITRTHQAVFDQGKFLKLETYKEDNTVIAWMPLPEPYKAER
jgi:hypothetical protein